MLPASIRLILQLRRELSQVNDRSLLVKPGHRLLGASDKDKNWVLASARGFAQPLTKPKMSREAGRDSDFYQQVGSLIDRVPGGLSPNWN
jgi:hypothetical protein